MDVKFYGFDEVERSLDKKYSRRSLDNAEQRALQAAGNMIRNKTESALSSVADTGQLARGTSIREPRKVNGQMIAYLHWTGKHLSLAHLNENGHYDKAGNWVSPRGLGKVSSTLKINADQYYTIIKRELNR